MTPYQKVIGWQKYEDFIEKQMSSPMLNNIMKHMMSIQDQEEDVLDDIMTDDDNNTDDDSFNMIMPITKELIEDLSLMANFDCWIGHTNFDLTHDIKNKLDKISGIELLKICSRYRFFIGIGQMFDFKNVRKDIEKEII